MKINEILDKEELFTQPKPKKAEREKSPFDKRKRRPIKKS